MGSTAPSSKKDGKEHQLIRSDNGVSTITNTPGSVKRKREICASHDAPVTKVKKNQDILDSSTSESEFNSSVDSENCVVSDSEINTNNNRKPLDKNKHQPPVVVTLNEELDFHAIHAIVNTICPSVKYKCNGKQVTLLIQDSVNYSKIIESLKIDGIKFHTYARKGDIKPKIILKGLP
ncbi:hypothetical protein PV325_008270, partial [Microctonus aethiopoides]